MTVRRRWSPVLVVALAALVVAGATALGQAGTAPRALGQTRTSTAIRTPTASAAGASADPETQTAPPRSPLPPLKDSNTPPCRSADLAMSVHSRSPSPPTGRNPVTLALTNRSGRACFFDGYPTVAVLGVDGSELPFRYNRGGGMLVTSRPPARVEVPPGGSAYVTIDKYRCDLGSQQESAAVRLAPPGDSAALRLLLAAHPRFDYCGPGDPGSTVDISPVAATVGGTTRS